MAFYSTYFYNQTTENSILAFLSLFKDLQVAKFDSQSSTPKNYRAVPLIFSQKEKYADWLAKQEAKTFSRYLPSIGVTLQSIAYDTERKVGQNNEVIARTVTDDTTGQTEQIFQPTPYKLTFSLSILAANLQESFQILEQIIPFFNPYYNLTVKDFSDIDYTRNMKITLNDVSLTASEDIDMDTVLRPQWDLTFTCNTLFFKPVETSNIIKSIYIDINDLDRNVLTAEYNYSVSGNSTSAFSVLNDKWSPS